MIESKPRTRSQIGRSNRRRGNETQNAWAKAIRSWWARAASSSNNGSATTADEGDITGTGALIFWSVKYDKSAHQDGQRYKWMTEMRDKAGPDRFGILVERRPLIGDPLRWFVHLWLDDYLTHALGVDPPPGSEHAAIRLFGADLVSQLSVRGLTDWSPVGMAAAVDLEAGTVRTAMEDANEEGVAAELRADGWTAGPSEAAS